MGLIFIVYLCFRRIMKNLIKDKLTSDLESFEINQGFEQRSIGDIIEYKVKNILMSGLKTDTVKEFLDRRSKKSIEDLTIVGTDGIKYYIDPKSHNIKSDFSMPNLTSIEKLRSLLTSQNEELIYIFVSYQVINNIVNITSINVNFLWELSFDILSIGSLGKGQLQISDMNKPLKFVDIGKKNWFLLFKKIVNEYHNKRIKQIEKDKLKWL